MNENVSKRNLKKIENEKKKQHTLDVETLITDTFPLSSPTYILDEEIFHCIAVTTHPRCSNEI